MPSLCTRVNLRHLNSPPPTPLLPCPTLMTSALLYTDMVESQCHVDLSFAIQVLVVQSTADGQLTDVDMLPFSGLLCKAVGITSSCPVIL